MPVSKLTKRFPNLKEWERGAAQPTLKQLEQFAKAVHVPIGFLFLPAPPVEKAPIPDFRSGGERLRQPSPELLDTVYICQQRQEWYRDHAIATGEEPLPFVGSASTSNAIEPVAATIRHALHLDIEERSQISSWSEALRRMVEQADAAGVLVMRNGVVLNNNNRPLEPGEFRGFTLSDTVAPLIFVNAADSKAAQMFTLAHELAHVWLGQTALGDEEAGRLPEDATERWCDQVAAEILVPLSAIREIYRRGAELNAEANRLARYFKVSSLVALRRVFDAGAVSRQGFQQAYDHELENLARIAKESAGGGDFYLTQGARVGKRFARALIESTAEGRTLYREALHLLGFTKLSTLHDLGRSLEVPV